MMDPINPRAVVVAHIAARLLAAERQAGMGRGEADILACVADAHETLYQSELAVSRPAPTQIAKQHDTAA